MKSLKQYITEADDKKDKKEGTLERGEIKFTIWESPDKKVSWLKDNESYQKIEYKYEDKKNKIYIDFLLGFQNDTWQLWIGRLGSCSYDDDSYKNFETTDFAKAIVDCLDFVSEFVDKVKEDPEDYVQFYKE